MRGRGLRLESLESRRLMATDVTWVYWNEGPAVFRSLDGSGPAEHLFSLDARYTSPRFDVDRTSGRVAVAAWEGHQPIVVLRSNADGTNLQTLNSTQLGTIVQAVAIDPADQSIFVSPHHLQVNAPGSIPGGMQKLSADGTQVSTFSQRPYYVPDMEVVPALGQVIYSTYPTTGGAPFGFTGIRKMNPDGSGDAPLFATGQSSTFAIAPNSSKIFYSKSLHYNSTTGRAIYRSNLDGSGTVTLIQETLGRIGDIDLNAAGTHLYWNVSADDGSRWLRSAKIDGTDLKTLRQLGPQASAMIGLFSTTINLPPTIDFLDNLSVDEDFGPRAIPLSGITAGGTEQQALRISAVSNSPQLIGNPMVQLDRKLGAPTLVTAGNTTRGIAVGDFNGDSYLDMAAPNQFTNNVTVAFGDGMGGYPSTLSLPMNSQPGFVVAGDFNGDGLDDIAVSNGESNVVTARLGNAQGTFSAATTYATGNGNVFPAATGVYYLATADFNNDGKLDLIANNIRHDFLSVLLGTGTGGFENPIKVNVGPAGTPPPHEGGPYGLTVGDWNQDGFTDAAVALLETGTVRVLLGDGTGKLTVSSSYPVDNRLWGLSTGDFNGDSRLDLAAINDIDSKATILLNDGNGTFTPLASIPAGTNARHVASGDLNQDGRTDLVTTSWAGKVYVLHGQGEGQFAAPIAYSYETPGREIVHTIVADMNRDGALDVVSGFANYQATGAMGVLWNQADTTGTLVFEPKPDRFGTAIITVTVEDAGMDLNLATPNDNGVTIRQFQVTVQAVNDPPYARDDDFDVAINQPIVLDVLANDTDIDDPLNPESLQLLSLPEGGSAEVLDGKILFTPNQRRLGDDSLTYRVQDASGVWSNTGRVQMRLFDRPEGIDDFASTSRDTSLTMDVVANDQAILSPIVRETLRVIEPPAIGTLNIVAGAIYYTPAALFQGEVRFQYAVSNEQGVESLPTQVVISVAGSRLQNKSNPVDVNASGVVTAIDALLVINELNLNGSRPIESIGQAPPPFFDVSGDFQISALDALLVINHLNLAGAGGPGSGEGEAPVDDGGIADEFDWVDAGSLRDSALLGWISEQERNERKGKVTRA